MEEKYNKKLIRECYELGAAFEKNVSAADVLRTRAKKVEEVADSVKTKTGEKEYNMQELSEVLFKLSFGGYDRTGVSEHLYGESAELSDSIKAEIAYTNALYYLKDTISIDDMDEISDKLSTALRYTTDDPRFIELAELLSKNI
jgi:ribosomal 50S subunit-associated protein YjgA (DUF615 family)